MSVQNTKSDQADVRSAVRERYGQIANEFVADSTASCCGPEDAADAACCGSENAVTLDQVAVLYGTPDAADLPPEVTGLSLGCGDPVTLASLEPGQTVLDLGAGGGIDCFLAAKQVGETGRVIGVDMTPAMLEKARLNKQKVGAENVEFRLGEIENLPVADDLVDVIISNCVINLSLDKEQVFREAYRVLKPGGRLAVSDIVTNGPLPESVVNNPSAWASCISGALDAQDYIAAIEAAGFVDITLTPVYMDKETVDAATEQLGLSDQVKNGGPKIILGEGKNPQVIELTEDEAAEFEGDKRYEKVFSAKVTAHKPL